MPEEEAHYYAEGVRRGGVLLTVHAADDMAERAASVLATHHPIDLTQRVEEWRQSGWSRFDADAEPSALAHSTPAQTRTPDKAYDSKVHTVVTAAPDTGAGASPHARGGEGNDHSRRGRILASGQTSDGA